MYFLQNQKIYKGNCLKLLKFIVLRLGKKALKLLESTK